MITRICSMRTVVAIVSLGVSVGASRDTSESETIRTRGIHADFVAIAGSAGTTAITATLRSGRNDVELTGGDFLIATTTQPMTAVVIRQSLMQRAHLFDVHYEREFPGNEKDTSIEIALDRRATGSVTAPAFQATLPTPFALHWVSSPITREPVPLDFSRSSNAPRFVVCDPDQAPDFEIGDVLSFSVMGTCIEPDSGTIDWDQGEDALELTNRLRDRAPPNDGQTCTVEVELRLSRDGRVDPAFRSGTFIAEQGRAFSLLARP